MPKFRLLAQHLADLGLLQEENHFLPEAPTLETLALAHCPQYVRAFLSGEIAPGAMRQIGLPWSDALARRTHVAVGGSLKTLELACERGLAAHLAGGTHHAHYDHGSGFCIFNDLAVMARFALAAGLAHRVLIIDCDVHQGDGTARILAMDRDILTCSVHCRENYPRNKAQSDFDIEVARGCRGPEYLQTLRQQLPLVWATVQPDLLLYDAGADVHREDRLGYLDLDDADLKARDEYILRLALDDAVPVACVIGGGYDHDHVRLARRHGLIHEVAARLFDSYGLS